MIARGASVGVAALIAFGCSTAQVGRLPTVTQVSVSSDTLQLSVGTATLAQQSGAPYVGLNVVATFRQPNGQPATVANTPSLSGPADFSGGLAGVPKNSIYGLTPQQVMQASLWLNLIPQFGPLAQTIDGSLFTSLVGVYGDGFAPVNIVAQQPNMTVLPRIPTVANCFGIVPQQDVPTIGSGVYAFNAVRYSGLLLPLFGGIPTVIGCEPHITTLVATHYYGGPPAWPSPQGYGNPVGFPGFPLGFTDFATPPASGAYALSVAVPANADGTSYTSVNASAQLPASAVAHPLPQMPQPVLRIQPDGSAFVDVSVPSGIAETIVLASTTRCDGVQSTNSAIPDQQYGIVVKRPGRSSLFFKNDLGPPDAHGTPLHTFCTAADTQKYGTVSAAYSLTAVGFDYPAYEASYPQSKTASPAITNGDGHHGTADLTAASPVVHQQYPLL
ncbi:MAG: hypothetical protein JO043_01975 [Candidatus Eremiobacteraeota bacterium]|nr:hypothetical protein [Candidatus Eremiobacteraeota bacterium]